MQGIMIRTITEALKEEIELTPAVVVLGARQAGKTTLAQTIAAQKPSIYLDLESPEDLAKLTDPITLLRESKDKLIVIDEFHRAPDLFMTLRGVIDQNRFAGKEGSQFLLLGSASMGLMRQASESLAGRISYMDLSGLNILEIGSDKTQQLWLRGGLPKCCLAKSDKVAMHRLEDHIRTSLERDIPQYGFRVPSARMRRLWIMLAYLQGETVNSSELARNLEVDRKTVVHYIDILTELLLVRRIEPWFSSAKKRRVKSPRYNIRDSGVLHRLLGVANYDALLSHPVLAKSWKGFVIENLYSVMPQLAETSFYCTSAGAEIDLVIKMPNARVWAIEIKFGRAPKPSKHFSRTCDDVGATSKYVVYGGEEEFPVGEDVRMISVERMMCKLDEAESGID